MSNTLKWTLGASVLALGWATMAAPALARATAANAEIDRDMIIVTAQKRAENVQRVRSR